MIADSHLLGRYELLLVRNDGDWKIAESRLLSSGEYGGARVGEQCNCLWLSQFENWPIASRFDLMMPGEQ